MLLEIEYKRYDERTENCNENKIEFRRQYSFF